MGRKFVPIMLAGLALLLPVFLLIPFTTFAAAKTWTGLGDDASCGGVVGDGNKWSCGLNWSGGTIPVTGDTVVFDSTSMKDSTIDSGFTSTISGMTVSGYTGTITNAKSSTWTINGAYTQTTGAFIGGTGDITLNGAFSLSTTTTAAFTTPSGQFTINGNFTHTSGGTFTATTGTMIIGGSTNWTWDVNTTETFNNLTINNSSPSALIISSGDTLNVLGTLTLTDGGWSTGTIAAQGSAITVGAGFGFANNTSGTLLVNGSGSQTVTLRVPTTSTFEPVDQLTISNTSATVIGTGSTGNINLDKVTITAGTMDLTGYTVTMNEATMINGGTLTFGTTGINTLAGSFTLTSGTVNGAGVSGIGAATLDVNSSLTISGGAFIATTGSMTMSGNFIHSAGTFDHKNGSITVDGSSAVTWDVPSSEELYDFTLNNTNSIGALTIESGDTLNVNHTTTLTDGAIVTGTLAIKGALATIGPNFGISVNTSGTLLVNGTDTQTVTVAVPTSSNFESIDQLTINNAAATVTGTGATGRIGFDKITLTAGVIDLTGYTVIANQTVLVNGGTFTLGTSGTNTFDGPFTLSSGTFNGAGSAGIGTATLDVNDVLAITGGTFNATSGTMTMSNSFDHSAGTFHHRNGTVVNDATSSFTWSVPLTEEFYNLTFNSTSSIGTRMGSGHVWTVTNILTLTDGAWNTGTIVFTGPSATIGASFGLANNTSGTLLVNGTSSQTIAIAPPALTTFEPVDQFTLENAAATVTGTGATGSINFDKITLTAGTLDVTGYTLTVSETTTMNGGTLTLGASGTNTFAGVFTLSSGVFNGAGTLGTGTATVDFNDDINMTGGAFTASGGTMSVARAWVATGGMFDASGGTVLADTGLLSTWTFDSAMVFSSFTLNTNGGSVGFALTIAGAETLVVSEDLQLANGLLSGTTLAVAGDVLVTSDFDGGDVGVVFTGSAMQTFEVTGAGAFDGPLEVDKSGGAVELLSALVMSAPHQSLAITEGTLDVNGFDLTVSGFEALFTVADGGNFQLEGDELLTFGSPIVLEAGSTVTYDGAGSYSSLEVSDAYANLVFEGTGTWQQDTALDVSGDLTVTDGTFDSNGNDITIAGNWVMDGGAYVHGGNTVIFDGRQQMILGSVDFYHLQKSSLSDDTFTFPAASRVTVVGSATVRGVSGGLLSLHSSNDGVSTNVDFQGIVDVQYVDVQDQLAANTSGVRCFTGCVDHGNNTRWYFSADAYGLLVTPDDGLLAVTEDGLSDTIEVVLSAPPASSVTVSVNAESDVTLSGDSLVFTVDNWSLPQTFTVTAIDDEEDEVSPETVSLTLTTTSADGLYDGLVHVVSVAVTDNDELPTIDWAVDSSSANEGEGEVFLTATLSAASSADVAIDVSFSGSARGSGEDYDVASTSFIIPVGETAGRFAVSVTDDAFDEDEEYVDVLIASATNATFGSSLTHTLYLIDNDEPPTIYWSAFEQTVDEAVGTAVFSANLSVVSGKDVSATVQVGGTATVDVDYQYDTLVISIPAGSDAMDLPVVIMDDADVEGDETVILTMIAAEHAELGGTIESTLTVTDNDVETPVDEGGESDPGAGGSDGGSDPVVDEPIDEGGGSDGDADLPDDVGGTDSEDPGTGSADESMPEEEPETRTRHRHPGYVPPDPEPTVELIHPDGGESFAVGETIPVRWTTTESPIYASISYSTDGGETWISIIDHLPAYTGSYDWTPSDGLMGDLMLRIAIDDLAQTVSADVTEVAFRLGSLSGTETDTERCLAVGAGHAMKGESFDTVYYIDEACQRRPFFNAFVYFTYFDSFDNIEEVPDAWLPSFGFGGFMPPKPGVVLGKFVSTPETYVIEENPADFYQPFLREIPDESVAKSLFGSSWADYVLDLDVTLYPHFGSGIPVWFRTSVDRESMQTRKQLRAKF